MLGDFINGTISITAVLAIVFGLLFLLLLFIVGVVIYLRGQAVPDAAMLIFRTILAISAGAVGWIIGGDIGLNFNVGLVAGKAVGGIALAALVYLVNPPRFIEQRIVHGGPPDGPPKPVTEQRRRESPAAGTDNE
jgi:hypothetical protein